MVYSFWNLDLLPIIIRKFGIEIKVTSPEGQVQHATKIQNHDAPKKNYALENIIFNIVTNTEFK